MLAFTTHTPTAAVGCIVCCVQIELLYRGRSWLTVHEASAETGILSPNFLTSQFTAALYWMKHAAGMGLIMLLILRELMHFSHMCAKNDFKIPHSGDLDL